MRKGLSCVLRGCGLTLILVGVCLLCLLIFTWPQPRREPVFLPDLLVEPEAFPAGWTLEANGEWEPVPERALVDDYRAGEGVIRFWVPPGCPNPPAYIQPVGCRAAWHMILRYRNSIQAAGAFYMDLPMAFTKGLKWEAPEGWSYRSPIADRFRFACSRECLCEGCCPSPGPYTYCTAMAQYDEFISVLDIKMIRNITLHDIEKILLAIDERVKMKSILLQFLHSGRSSEVMPIYAPPHLVIGHSIFPKYGGFSKSAKV